MPEDNVRKIRGNHQLVGIMGLKPIIEEMAQAHAGMSDEEIQSALTRRISEKNYIPGHAREAYGKAFLREFNKCLGRPYEDDGSEGLEIKILGPGCGRCDQLEKEVMEVTGEMKLVAAVEHVRDMKEIARYGVMGTPALVINGKVVSVGAVPSRVKIKAWLRAFV